MPNYNRFIRAGDQMLTVHELTTDEATLGGADFLRSLNRGWKAAFGDKVDHEAIDRKTSPGYPANQERVSKNIGAVTLDSGPHYVTVRDEVRRDVAAVCKVETFQPTVNWKNPWSYKNIWRDPYPNITELAAVPPHKPRSLAPAAALFYALGSYRIDERLTWWTEKENDEVRSWAEDIGFEHMHDKPDPDVPELVFSGYRIVENGVFTARAALLDEFPEIAQAQPI